jgi:ATP/maltotriose-dependent transcriptional regulator MalT
VERSIMQDPLETATRLTAREADVLRLLARGLTYTQVSDTLGVSLHTVTTHIKNVYRKLEVHSARAAIWRALELKLLGEERGNLEPATASAGWR